MKLDKDQKRTAEINGSQHINENVYLLLVCFLTEFDDLNLKLSASFFYVQILLTHLFPLCAQQIQLNSCSLLQHTEPPRILHY